MKKRDGEAVLKDKWQSRAGRLVCAAIVLGGVYIVLKYALGLVIPFLVAWAIGASVNFFAKKSSKRLRGSAKAWRVFFVASFWGFALLLLTAIIRKVSNEAMDFFAYISEDGDKIAASLRDIVESVAALPSRIPFIKNLMNGEGSGNLGDSVNGAVKSAISAVAKKGSELLAIGIGKLLVGTPKALISLAVCVISSVYLSLDYEKIKEYLLKILSDENQGKAKKIFSRIGKGLRGYAKAYFFLFLINFALLYVGLLVLGRKYSFLIAFAVALFDLLPLFGAGIVLVPWALVLIAGENYVLGVGMLVLFGIMSIVRQIAEPRLVGDSLGIHPLASLSSMFIGFRVFGFWGMVLAPVGVLVVKELIADRQKNVEKEQKTLNEKY